MSTNTNTDKSFRYALQSIGVFLLLIVLSVIMQLTKLDELSIIIGILVLIMSCLGIVGLVYSIKSIKEPSHYKKWIGLLVNVLVVIGFIALLIANFLDIQGAL